MNHMFKHVFLQILALFWVPKSDQIGSKRVPKSIKKGIEKLVEFGIDLLTIFRQFWLRIWGPRGSNQSGFRGQVGSRSHLGTQMAPGAQPGSISCGSGSIWNRFWLHGRNGHGWPGLPTASKCLTESSHRQTWAHNMQD